MPKGPESDETAHSLARRLERDGVQRERAMMEFRASLPVRSPSADPVEDLVVVYEHWFKQLDNAAKIAQALSTKHECSVRETEILDALKAHFLSEVAKFEPRIYARAREHSLADRWITTLEGLQELINKLDRLHRRDLMSEQPGPFQRVINELIHLKKQLPEEFARVRRLGATIPPVRREPRINTGLRQRLIKALIGRTVLGKVLAAELRITPTALRSVISAMNRSDRIVLNTWGKGYYLRDHPPPDGEDLKRV